MNALRTKIVLDSSADMPKAQSIPLASVPLKIITAEKEYVDNEKLDVGAMITDLRSYSGKSSTSCPNPQEFLEAFGDADYVFCITITGSLSGSNNAANIAARQYEEAHPGRKARVFDSLSTGPELVLLARKIEEEIISGKEFSEVCDIADAYLKKTGLLFMLESLKNLANNGRVSPIAAKMSSVLGIRVVGKASDAGTLQPLNKCRGSKKALATIWEHMKNEGYRGGKVKLAHCNNEAAAKALTALINAEYPGVKPEIYPCRALCSFYAEEGGLLVGYEKA
ncbi:MAG: DegV family protein [Clostridia bacterium]|nr:DegV family protein [Clostridia bacterium]